MSDGVPRQGTPRRRDGAELEPEGVRVRPTAARRACAPPLVRDGNFPPKLRAPAADCLAPSASAYAQELRRGGLAASQLPAVIRRGDFTA